jgi:hypothetical protein
VDAEPVKYLVGRLRQALAEDPRTNILDVQITIRAGKAFLEGQVDSAALKEAVEEVTRELLPPDLDLVNELWVPTYGPPETETVR